MPMAFSVRQTCFVSYWVMFPKIFVQISVKVSYKFTDFYTNVHRGMLRAFVKRNVGLLLEKQNGLPKQTV